MERKIIHYCWFGNNPLPKLAKKCIKSWKKYLPDYEIIEWNETNVNLKECPFIKEAYESKKWAFVADYARTRALNEMGGIYFDTDMLLKKDISFLLDKGTILGVEDSRMANAAVWIENTPKSWFSTELLNFYKSQKHFNDDDIYSISIPRMINKIIMPLGFDYSSDEIQTLKHDIIIYPREYFYPLSYNYSDNVFTENTCMIHYFDATWIPKKEQWENKLYRKVGLEKGRSILNKYRFIKRNTKRAIKLVLFPVVIYRNNKRKYNEKYLNNIESAVKQIEKCKKDYIVFHNPEWFGVTSATIELFESRVSCGELLRKKDVELVGNTILENKKIKQIVFSAMCIGWKDLAIYLKDKNPDIKIKTFWHGNHSQVSEPYGWARNLEIISLHKMGIIDVMGTCKESLINFYKEEGYKTAFITNKVVLKKPIKNNTNKDEIRIGLYAAKSDDWRKNMFAQIASVALIDNAVLDMVPLNKDAVEFAKMLNIKLVGLDKPIPREKLIERMSHNNINLYVTFSECAPMLPLESFEVGVPCITGNNHHYFKNSELEKYLVVNNEENSLEIADKIKLCLENKKEVMKLYKKFVKENNRQSEKDVENFLNM
jgi:mannosyltransferase OCH1-like enzyme